MMLHSALMEIVGPEASASMLSQLSEPNSWPLAKLRAHLMDRYGARSGAGLLWRIGRTYFREYLTNLEDDCGLLQAEQRYLPFKRKAAEGLAILGKMFSEIGSQRIHDLNEGRYSLLADRMLPGMRGHTGRPGDVYLLSRVRPGISSLDRGRQSVPGGRSGMHLAGS